jgi:hypothetical protein
MRPNLSRLRHHCRLDLYYSGIIATPTLLWYCAASCSNMGPNLISFAASCRLKSSSWLWDNLRHHCQLDSSSCRMTCSIIADLWLTATFPLLWDPLSPNNVGRTSSLHYYYLAFVVLTYLAYLIAVVNTSHISFGYYKPGHTSPLLH